VGRIGYREGWVGMIGKGRMGGNDRIEKDGWEG
jgi:hypothetical protein